MRKLLLVGTGNIARDYVKVLRGLTVPFDVIGRSETGCTRFSKETGIKARAGGVQKYSEDLRNYCDAIVAIDASQLADVSCCLMQHGISNILIEKPGGLTRQDFESIVNRQKATGSDVYIAYNRRFYSSVLHAEKMIRAEGGVKSFHFEFTEWPHTVLSAGLPEETLQSWFLCNSTHIVDLAFYLGGLPAEIAVYSKSCLPWTEEKGCYAGAGISQSGALFDYCANWNAPGRWSVEMLTDQHRFIFRPLEKLQIQELKSVEIKFADTINYGFDLEYKPGLYREVSAFLGLQGEDRNRMKTATQQMEELPLYEQIAGRKYSIKNNENQ